MMRHRIALLAVAVVAFLGTGATMADGAAQAGHPPGPGPFQFSMSASPHNCIETHGAGNQLTDGDVCARLKVVPDSVLGGQTTYTFTDGSGNCIRANSSDVVLVEGGPCNPSDDGEQWVITSCVQSPPGTCKEGQGGKYRFENVKQKLWLKVTGPVSGDKVWVGTGDDNEWDLY